MSLDLRYYLAVLLARLHHALLIFVAVTTIAVTLALRLPASYDSSATLLLQSPQIPDALATPTVSTADLEQLQVLQQRLMTRPNLLEIARKFAVFPRIDRMSPDEIVEAMEKATVIDIHTGHDQAALMAITFSAGSARAAADVVNEYVTRIQAEDLAIRTGQARDTLQFFRQEVDRLQGDLAAQSAKLVAFQNANTMALPGTLSTRMDQQQTFQDRLNAVSRDIAALEDQKARLIQQFKTRNPAAAPLPDTPEAKLLAQARQDLASALAVYAADAPKVKLLKSRVAQLEETVKAQTSDEPATGGTPVHSVIDNQIADIDAKLNILRSQRDDISVALAAVKVTIERTPQVAAELDALNRDFAAIQAQFTSASDRLAKASTGERIEALSKGQRVSVLDPAAVPDTPTRPNRLKLAIYGAAAGLILGIGFVVVTELLDISVRRPLDLVRGLEITPIGTIPYIHTPAERARRRTAIGGLLVLVVLGLPAMLYAVDSFYQPLGVIVGKIGSRLGM